MVPEKWSMMDRICLNFGPFLPFNNLKKQNFEKMKKSQEILSLCTSVPKNMIICYTVPEIQRVTDVIFIFHFGLFFVLYPSNNPKNQNLKKKKKKKNAWRYHRFTYVYQKVWSHDVRFLRYGARQTDGRKKVTYRGGCPT